MSGVAAGHEDPRDGIADALNRAAVLFSKVTRVGAKDRRKKKSFEDVPAGFVGNRGAEALGVTFPAIAPFRIGIAGLRDARAHRRSGNAQWMHRVKRSNLQLSAGRVRVVRRRCVRYSSFAVVLL